MQHNHKRTRVSLKAGLFLSLLFLGASFTPTAISQAPGAFTSTGTMTTPRAGHTATLLLKGKVLIVGGDKTVLPSSTILPPEPSRRQAMGPRARRRCLLVRNPHPCLAS